MNPDRKVNPMDKQARRAAAKAYKERPLDWGVYVLRCQATGQAWVGASRRLGTQKNVLWFTLRAGGCINKAVQAAWSAAGEGAFVFEILEQLPPDTGEFERVRLLQARAEDWRGRLEASAF
jgi:hypothetical protein